MPDAFFPRNVRRETRLRTAAILVNRSEERRIKLSLEMPLTGESLIGLPDWIAEAHDAVASQIDTATVDNTLEALTVDVFATDQGDKRELQLTSCQLKKFVVLRAGEAEDPDVVLQFTLYTPFNTAAWTWAGGIAGYTFYAKFDVAQMELQESA